MTLGALPIGVGLLGWRFVPESPRFLLAHGRPQAATALARELAVRHGVEVPVGDPRRRPAASAPRQLAELWGPRWRRRTFTLWTTWIGINTILVGPIAWLPILLAERGSTLALQTSALVGFAMLPGTLAAVALIDRAGRRPLLLGSLGLSALGSVPLMASPDALWIGCGAAAVAAGVLAAWPVVLAWASEQYPTRMRASAVGWASGCARLGAIAAPAATGLLLGPGGADRASAVLPFSVLLLGAFVCVAVFGEETAGRSLEELTA